jgi:hypothetical protein
MNKRKDSFIRGAGTHRRTESDYMAVLLDTVSLEDWRDVVSETLQRAKQGDPQARAWLAQYLVGRPEVKAPTPMTVVVNQWAGRDTLAERLAAPLIDRAKFPILHEDDGWAEELEAAVAVELAQKLPASDSNKSEFPK